MGQHGRPLSENCFRISTLRSLCGIRWHRNGEAGILRFCCVLDLISEKTNWVMELGEAARLTVMYSARIRCMRLPRQAFISSTSRRHRERIVGVDLGHAEYIQSTQLDRSSSARPCLKAGIMHPSLFFQIVTQNTVWYHKCIHAYSIRHACSCSTPPNSARNAWDYRSHHCSERSTTSVAFSAVISSCSRSSRPSSFAKSGSSRVSPSSIASSPVLSTT